VEQSTDDIDPHSQIRYDAFIDGMYSGSVTGTGRMWNSWPAADPIEVVVTAMDSSGNQPGPSNTVSFDCQ
jgi:hypothetical protein